eukprot:2321260-Karenia_brevis.AAC.1
MKRESSGVEWNRNISRNQRQVQGCIMERDDFRSNELVRRRKNGKRGTDKCVPFQPESMNKDVHREE